MSPTLEPRSHHSTAPAGRMTHAMRAALPTGEIVLRVGWVQEGRVVEERRLRRGQTLSVGSSEKCDFTLGSEGAPRFLRVFGWTAKSARLHVDERISGRVVLESGVCDLDQLRARARAVDLQRGARGKLVIGNAALLFQVVLEAPRPAHPQLPLSLKQRPLEVDWLTTIVGALSFLLHFGVVGALYSDWADPVLDDDLVIAGLVDAIALPTPPPLEDTQSTPDPAAATTAPTPTPKPEPGPRDSGRRGPNENSKDTARADQAGLARELQTLALETVGTLGSEGPATRDVLRDGDLPLGPLDEAARDARGVSSPAELALSSGGPVSPGPESGRLADLANPRRALSEGTGRLDRPRGPTGTTTLSPPATTGIVPDAERVIYGLRSAFRRCYQRGLDQYPDAEGAVRLTFVIQSNGDPGSVGAAPSGNLPPSIVSCIQGHARSAQFAPPEGGSAVVVAPVILKKQ
jgi:hypothetical protein